MNGILFNRRALLAAGVAGGLAPLAGAARAAEAPGAPMLALSIYMAAAGARALPPEVVERAGR
jgi:hypothetical protein